MKKNFIHILRKAIQEKAPDLLFQEAFLEARGMLSDDLVLFLRQLGRIAEIRLVAGKAEKVGSAALSLSGNRFYLTFNTDFLREYVREPASLLHLILHELGHRLRGDLLLNALGYHRESELNRMIMNVAADLILDSALDIIIYRDAPPPPYLVRLYRDGNLLFQLLCPPPGLLGLSRAEADKLSREERREQIKKKLREGLKRLAAAGRPRNNPGLFRAFEEDVLGQAARLYERCWCLVPLPSFAMVYSDLKSLVGKLFGGKVEQVPAFLPLLVGDHSGEGEKDHWWEWFKNQPGFKNFGRMGGYSEIIQEDKTRNEVQGRECWELYEAIRQALTTGGVKPTIQEQFVLQRGVVPAPGRKEIFLLEGGYHPVFYDNNAFDRSESENRVHIYIDVSGSISDYIHLLFGLVAHAGDLVGEPVYLFSNKVCEASLRELKAGEYKTTFGTDIDCVARHALEHKFHKILIITDGFFTRVNESLEDDFRKNVACYFILVLAYTDEPNSSILKYAGGWEMKGKNWWMINRDMIKAARLEN